jgi:uncharacterized protein YutE (UPF0331/DUF86 family)
MVEVSEEDFLEDDKTKLAIYKASSREVLIEAYGLRNHLVHRYNRRGDLIAMQSMKELQDGIMTFGEEMEMWLEKMSSPQ